MRCFVLFSVALHCVASLRFVFMFFDLLCFGTFETTKIVQVICRFATFYLQVWMFGVHFSIVHSIFNVHCLIAKYNVSFCVVNWQCFIFIRKCLPPMFASRCRCSSSISTCVVPTDEFQSSRFRYQLYFQDLNISFQFVSFSVYSLTLSQLVT